MAVGSDFGPITEEHRLTYQANIELAIQQRQSELEPAFVYHPGMSGRSAKMLDLVGETSARINPPRGGDTPDIQGNYEQTWMSPVCIDWGRVIELEDDIKAAISFLSTAVQAGAAAIVRGRDQIRANAIFGDRKTGQDGTETTTWDPTNKNVPTTVGSPTAVPTGMNVKKILRAFRLLEQMKVKLNEHELYCLVDPIEMEELYGDITFVSKDYRSKAVIEEKRVMSILGVTLLPTTYVPDLDATTSRAVLCAKGALHEGEFYPVTTKIEPNPAKRYRPHPYIETWMGATRGEDKMMIEIRNLIPTP
jgi:hypothetical protein